MQSAAADLLRSSLSRRQCFLYCGDDVFIEAGFPPFLQFVSQIVPDTLPDDFEAIADTIRLSVQPLRLEDAVVTAFDAPGRSTPTMDFLRELPFSGALTLSWTDYVERQFRERVPLSYWPGRQRVEPFSPSRFVTLHPFGSVSEPRNVRLSWGEYRETERESPEFSDLFRQVAHGGSVLFVGAAPRTIRDVLRAAGTPRDTKQTCRHVALILGRGGEAVESASALLRPYGVNVVHVASRQRRLEWLRRVFVSEAPSPRAPSSRQVTSATRLKLERIGPFKSLTLRLHPRATVLVGDNSSGKTTVLRAMALALSGASENPSVVGGALLTSGATHGRISLTIDGTEYTTLLARGARGVRVESTSVTPVRTGQMQALGFPAARGRGSDRVRGPQPLPDGNTHDDLEPLYADRLDTRLDDVEQLLVNAWVVDRTRGTASFTDGIRQLLPEVGLELAGVDEETWSVVLRTPDGQIGFDQLSSGVRGMLGWAGVVMERLSRKPSATSPVSGPPPAVLIDEIDLHLHPAWQQELPPRLRQQFPECQFVFSTHSPLVVGSLGKDAYVYRFDRAAGSRSPHVEQISQAERTAMRADQMLTGPAFGLQTTLDASGRQLLEKYSRDFATAQARNDTALAERLGNELRARLSAFESREEAAGVDLVNGYLRAALSAIAKEQQPQVAAMALAYLDSLGA